MLFSFRKPVAVGRSFTPMLALVVAVVCGVCVLVTAALWARHADQAAIRERESLIAGDMVASIDRILDSVISRAHSGLATLPGRPCPLVEHRLSELQTYVLYVRSVNLVANQNIYCSSALGSIDMPLAAYLSLAPARIELDLIAGTPQQPREPVMPLYVPTSKDTGLLYVVEARYLADTLAHGVRYEAGQVVLVVSNARALDAYGEVISAESAAKWKGTRASSARWAFSIVVVAAPAFVTQTHWKYGLLASAAAILVNLLIAAAYLIAFAPRRLLLSAVRRALKHGQLHFAYQPVVEIATRRIMGVEALIRWTHPRWGAVSPAAFMTEVERSSLLASVTRFALQRATEEIMRKTELRPLRIAVNVAPMDLERKDFVADVLAVHATLPADITLVLEVTERFLIDKHPRTDVIFNLLKAQGVRFAIDDFGTQHSNLDLLGRFPFDYVKIDGEFVRQVDKQGGELIRAIAAVSKHYGMEVIAEGVETQAQHEALRSLGIPYGQGYLYQRPVPASRLFVDTGANVIATKTHVTH
ncbi:EAL domain-containing protein [Paraburkholderia phymatum]|uniref:cyclic-guanylate-specific phosphodiesterase n=1 Tax=Paraburkholderia phymatum (strain DSM 17167 / CIP 108236 / LMG 21445 / STM815) TaxID=391038 RepID=B2JUW5_PARP8|nr:EAL domain-containing protein [Paraburkholderia phymatum]ACC74743.1 diguanylate phosphodiesterase [Paraburkholderia phymatum STM815]